ncbi:MAG TPA: hypothetical protein VIE91_02735 [Methylophilaceae bacterium]|jgi:hypothetical protein
MIFSANPFIKRSKVLTRIALYVKRYAPKLRILLICSVIPVVLGCASNGTVSEQDWRERMIEDARKPGVMAQFCVLETTLPGYLHASDVQRKDGRGLSMGSALSSFLGTTSSGQSIFESYLGKLDEFTAAVIFPTSKAQQVFLANNELYAVETWSQWVRPDLVSSDREIGFKLLYGKKVTKEDQGPVTVLARFKMGSYVKWRGETGDLRSKNQPNDLESCPLTPHPTL